MLICGYPIGLQVLRENMFLHGCLSPWATGPLSVLLQHRLPLLHLSFRAALAWRLPQTTVWISIPLWTSMSCRRSPCVTTVFMIGSGEKLFSSSLSTSSPLLLRPWCCQSCFSHIFSVLSVLQCCFTLLKCLITEILSLSLMCSALASGKSILELVGNGSVHHTDNFWRLLTKATPEALRYQNLATWTKHSNILKTHMFSMILRKYI